MFDTGVESEFLALKQEAGLLEDKSAPKAAAASSSSDDSADDEFEKLKAELKN